MQPHRLEPLPKNTAKFWSVISSLFVISGLSMIGFGGWLLIGQQLEVANPPARVVETAELLAEPTAPALAKPLGSQPSSPIERSEPAIFSDELVQAKFSETEPVIEPEPSPTLRPAQATRVAMMSELADTSELGLIKQAAVVQTAEDEKFEAAAVEAGEEAIATTQISQPEDQSQPLTLADNPLVVVEDEAGQPAPDEDWAGETPGELPASSGPRAVPLTRIVADSIGLDTTVVEVGWQKVVRNGVETNVWIVADYAAGWHRNSSLPGEGGNIVISGHHNIKGEIFRYIVDLEPGTIISLYDANNQRRNYYVDDKFIVKDKGEPEAVRRENAKWIGQFNEERLTMITCWPYNNNTHRVIVISKPLLGQ